MVRDRERLLLTCGAVGAILFYIVFTVAGAFRPGYSAMRDFVSDLSLGDQGWEQIANFIVFGVLMLAFTLGVRSALRTGRAAVAGPLLLGVFGAGVLLAGVFVTDPGPNPTTIHGSLHILVSIASFAALGAAGFVFARRFGGWRGFGLYSIASGLAVIVLFVLTQVVGQPLGIAGLVQRTTIAVGWVWIVLVAIRLLRRPATQ